MQFQIKRLCLVVACLLIVMILGNLAQASQPDNVPPVCPSLHGVINCDGNCVNAMTDESNCGSCGYECQPGDICLAGSCIGSAAIKDCDDGNPCTDEVWEKGGCVYTPNNQQCDDSNACTDSDVCAGGECAGSAITCTDGNICTDDSCNPANGCVFTNNILACDDSNACTDGDVCSGGICTPGNAVSCDDSNACNGLETCDPATGCVASAPLTCDDSNACNGLETCDPATGCVASAPLTCDDSNACNGLETCDPATGCIVGILPDCDDENACTIDECDPASGCTNTPVYGGTCSLLPILEFSGDQATVCPGENINFYAYAFYDSLASSGSLIPTLRPTPPLDILRMNPICVILGSEYGPEYEEWKWHISIDGSDKGDGDTQEITLTATDSEGQKVSQTFVAEWRYTLDCLSE